MNRIETENAAALAEVYAGDLAVNGVQAESVQIDGVAKKGQLTFDAAEIELVLGGTNEDVKAVFSTLKQYFPDGYPTPLRSTAQVTVNGVNRTYQVRQLNGDKDNRAQLFIGFGAMHNRK